MRKTLLAILLSLTISSCCTTPRSIKYIRTAVIIPEHQTLKPLTPEEVSALPTDIRQKMEYNRAALIGNIKALEINIQAHNEMIIEKEKEENN